MIDWETFSARVEAGRTQVKWEFGTSDNWNYGILLEAYPYRDAERPMQGEPQEDVPLRSLSFVRVQSITGSFGSRVPLNKRPKDLHYLIDGVWLTFAEVMQGDIPRAEG